MTPRETAPEDTTAEELLLARLAEQEERLVFGRFDNDTAYALGDRMVCEARRRGLAITVSVRRGGQLLFHAALPGTSLDNEEWAERKSRVVDRYGHSSYLVGTRFRVRGSTFDARSRLDPARYAASGGSFPVVVRDVGPVGSVTVSGLREEEDHAFVVEQLAAFLGVDPGWPRQA
ncbi:heme-degrading domain-containing protein [Saccharothrix syringae]|uniref:UPF0303 protein EKG83_21260 n=1 Tax=Saccharothrix syringae TaxID=103733 RepID=A0A5Q0H1R8_SACSY|nr:heme-degrading domain-containing protein [Saccharothrix syringae]QFZ19622.1 heme-degrading domain-containing protein [Saccharothrix syringae]